MMKFSKTNIVIMVLTTLFIVFIGSFLRQPKIYTFYKEQFVPSDMDSVFEFFSRPENLEKITPSSMGFNIITPTPIEMKEGAPSFISIGVGVIILKPIDDGVIFSRFSGLEKNSNTLSISLGTNCSL